MKNKKGLIAQLNILVKKFKDAGFQYPKDINDFRDPDPDKTYIQKYTKLIKHAL